MPFSFWILVLMHSVMASEFSHANCSQLSQLLPDNPPQKLSETGVFEDLVNLKPCPSVTEYEVNLPFWSDSAAKRRWIILPPNKKIQFLPEDPWKFPDGTIFVKHFELQSSATQQTRVETRLLMKLAEDDWYGYSYQWQTDQKEAILLDDSATLEYPVFDPTVPGGIRKQNWSFPSQRACLECHNSWSGYVLGARTEQVNLTPHGKTSNQLDLWNEKDFFSSKIEKATQYKSFVQLSDQSKPLALRVRSYLASNCAQCHQPESPVRSKIDFRFKTPLEAMNLIDQKPNAGEMDIPDPFLVKPGKKESSILWHRLKTPGTQRMPPLGSNEKDLEGVDLIGTWIDQL